MHHATTKNSIMTIADSKDSHSDQIGNKVGEASTAPTEGRTGQTGQTDQIGQTGRGRSTNPAEIESSATLATERKVLPEMMGRESQGSRRTVRIWATGGEPGATTLSLSAEAARTRMTASKSKGPGRIDPKPNRYGALPPGHNLRHSHCTRDST